MVKIACDEYAEEYELRHSLNVKKRNLLKKAKNNLEKSKNLITTVLARR